MIIGYMTNGRRDDTRPVVWNPSDRGIFIKRRRIGRAKCRRVAIGLAICWAMEQKFWFEKINRKYYGWRTKKLSKR